MSLKHSCCVLFTSPAATHTKRLLLQTNNSQGVHSSSEVLQATLIIYCSGTALVQTLYALSGSILMWNPSKIFPLPSWVGTEVHCPWECYREITVIDIFVINFPIIIVLSHCKCTTRPNTFKKLPCSTSTSWEGFTQFGKILHADRCWLLLKNFFFLKLIRTLLYLKHKVKNWSSSAKKVIVIVTIAILVQLVVAILIVTIFPELICNCS